MIVTNSDVLNPFRKQQLIIEFESPIEVDGFWAIFNTSIIAKIAEDSGINSDAIRTHLLRMYPNISQRGFLVLRNGKLEPTQ